MTELSILGLKPEYQQMVMENQKKYNPDFNDTLNNEEIGVLLTETGKTKEDLFQGLTVDENKYRKSYYKEPNNINTIEQLEKYSQSKVQDRKVLKEKQKTLIKEQKLLETYKNDLDNDTVKGLKTKPSEDLKVASIASACGVGALPLSISGLGLIAMGMMNPEISRGADVIKDMQALKKIFGVGLLAAAVAGGAVYGIGRLVKRIQLNNPKNYDHQEYVRTLPRRIEIQEQKVQKLLNEIETIKKSLGE